MTNFSGIKSKMAAIRPFEIFFIIISEILLIYELELPHTLHRLFDSHIINPLITRATNKEILVSTFQEKVSSRFSFYLANMLSNVSQ